MFLSTHHCTAEGIDDVNGRSAILDVAGLDTTVLQQQKVYWSIGCERQDFAIDLGASTQACTHEMEKMNSSKLINLRPAVARFIHHTAAPIC